MKKEKPVNLIASAVLFCVYVLTTVIDALTVRQISVSSSILCIGALIAYFVFLRRFEPLYYLGILVFTFFAQYLGACLHFYNIIPIYDLILHSASGILLVLLAHYLLTAFFIKDIEIPLRLTLLCCFLFSVAAAGIWEIWEFSGDVPARTDSAQKEKMTRPSENCFLFIKRTRCIIVHRVLFYFS